METELFYEGYKLRFIDLNPDASKLSASDALTQVFLDDYDTYQKIHAGKIYFEHKSIFYVSKEDDFYIGALYPKKPNEKHIVFRSIYDFEKKKRDENNPLDTSKNGIVNFLFEEEEGEMYLYVFGLTLLANMETSDIIYEEIIKRVNNRLEEYGYKIETSDFDVDDSKSTLLMKYATKLTANESRILRNSKNKNIYE